MAARPVPRTSGPWVNAAVEYSRSARIRAVLRVCSKDVQKAAKGQVIRALMLKIASPVIKTPESGWSRLTWPGVWPGV